MSGDQAFDLPNLCKYFSERSPTPMLAVEGPNSIVRHANSAFLRLAGMRRSALADKPFCEAIHEGVANLCGATLERVYKTGTPEVLAEQEHGLETGKYWTYSVWAILGPDEAPVGVMIQITDSTEVALYRKQSVELNEKLMVSTIQLQISAEKSEKLAKSSEALAADLKLAIQEKQYFIAILSHELRTPLSPVLIAASMLQQDQRLDPDVRDLMQMVHRNVSLEARLIDDLLDMTRMDRGKLKLDRHPIDLVQVIQHAIEISRPDLEAGNLALSFDSGIGAAMVLGDATRLQQVFSNLLRNAVKFTPAGGKVGIRCTCDPTLCRVDVTDSGIGMDPEFLPKAFEAFEQDQTDRPRAGLGLGLAICKTVVDLHGGKITARSQGKDRGSTFEVLLPSVVDEQLRLPKPKQSIRQGEKPARLLRILLVEDHADTARIMRRLLTADGHVVEWAPDVTAGIRLAGLEKFDLLLSDLGLPDGSGMDLMRSLRKSGSDLPGIVVSGYGQDQDVARSLEVGFAAHLVKPLSVEALRNAIATLW